MVCYNYSAERGRHPSNKTDSAVNNKGMIPIEKNISVIDENGNEYEATYPKRAKGLVKKGRARFVDDNTICLACPPDITEDTKMSDNTNVNVNVNANEETLNVGYILKQMAAIQQDNAHIYEALTVITRMPQGDSGEPGSPGDIAGQAKATAIADVVRCRETTNQKLLAFYEKVYDDIGDKKVDEILRIFEKVQSTDMASEQKVNVTIRAYDTIMAYLESMQHSFASEPVAMAAKSDESPKADPIDKAIDDAVNKSIQDSINKSIEESLFQEFYETRP